MLTQTAIGNNQSENGLKAKITKDMISLPLIRTSKVRLKTSIQIGNNTKPSLVIVDTGSPWLLIQEQHLSDYEDTGKKVNVGYGYGQSVQRFDGKVVYADITLNTTPKVIIKKVPIIMVPDGAFHGSAGILGLRLHTQSSLFNYLPPPYNEAMIVNAPQGELVFTKSSNKLIKDFHTIQLRKSPCYNLVKPRKPIDQTSCWQSGRIPVTYHFVDHLGKTILKNTYGTLFDSGGVITQFALKKIPTKLKKNTIRNFFEGRIESAVFGDTKYKLPMSDTVKVTQSSSNHINSGPVLFFERAILYDSFKGVVGVKEIPESDWRGWGI
ncbi:hypothetical protein L3V79_06075 [Thiotrichales bacterium 19S9-12]|nr:hypothetical protein [Thiotrichales bacterium 19S9-11]MCF6811925.1 hypothetical protein [Thiotrichales bacterium 19S9-12]